MLLAFIFLIVAVVLVAALFAGIYYAHPEWFMKVFLGKKHDDNGKFGGQPTNDQL